MAGTAKRDRLAELLQRTRLGPALARAGAWRGLLVLNYHRIGDASHALYDPGVFSATADEFDAQLAVLARDAEVVGIEALLEPSTRSGRRVLLTFDDGYRDAHTLAFPLLSAHGLSATFFLATGFLDRPRLPWWDEIAWLVRRGGGGEDERGRWLDAYKRAPGPEADAVIARLAEETGGGRFGEDAGELWLTWDMVREMRAAGQSFGGHTVEHPVLARWDAERQRAEIEGCAARLEAELGEPMRWFSYPVGLPGTFDATTESILRAAGVRFAFAFAGGHARWDRWDPVAIPRASVSHDTPRSRFSAMLAYPRVFASW
jgi:peptidoglycan/xylan/chitin deacetylase (PgdA/CDA1 family)